MFHNRNTPLFSPRKGTVPIGHNRVKLDRRVFSPMRRSYDESYPEGVWMTAEMFEAQLNQFRGGNPMTETIWKCDQLRAGQLYNRLMFDTRDEAEQFAHKMRQAEPDQVFSIEAIAASQVWN